MAISSESISSMSGAPIGSGFFALSEWASFGSMARTVS